MEFGAVFQTISFIPDIGMAVAYIQSNINHRNGLIVYLGTIFGSFLLMGCLAFALLARTPWAAARLGLATLAPEANPSNFQAITLLRVGLILVGVYYAIAAIPEFIGGCFEIGQAQFAHQIGRVVGGALRLALALFVVFKADIVADKLLRPLNRGS